MTSETVLKETNPSKFIYELTGFITDPNIGGVTPLDLESAPPLVKGIIFLSAFDLSTSTSGIGIWFDQEYADFPKLEVFFEKIGALKAAAYVRAGKALFPRGRVLKDWDARTDFTDAYDKEFRQVDLKFRGATEESIVKLREYILAHREEFERQTKAFWEIRKSNKPKWQKRIQKYLRP